MGTYTVHVMRNGKVRDITGEAGESLMNAFIRNDIYISAACGGKGKCGKCGVRMTEAPVEITETDRKFFDEKELAEGWRLSCLAFPEGVCSVEIETGDESDFEIVSEYQNREDGAGHVQEAYYDIGIDIGTTTIAVNLIGGTSKTVCNTYTTINKQRAYGADVISRIQASNDGRKEELKISIRKDLYEGITQVIQSEGISPKSIKRIAIAGNTTMGHLLMGYSCETLGVYPFTPVNIGTIQCGFEEMFGGIEGLDGALTDARIILLPGISTYVGADISAGMLSCGFDHCDLSGVDWSALVDERKREMGFLPFDALTGCSLRHCVFFGLDLKGFDFSGADLSGSFFDGCNLEEASFRGCRLGGVSFAQNNMSGADFRDAADYLFSLEGNRVKGARFSLPEAVNLLSALGIVLEE